LAASLSQSALSTQFVQVAVTAMLDGAPYNPTADTVQVAFVPVSSPPSSPGPSDWHTAAWETDPGPVYWASVLVGPANGGIALAYGSYTVWLKITDYPGIPALPGPLLSIF
jgi:hypothetical protein